MHIPYDPDFDSKRREPILAHATPQLAFLLGFLSVIALASFIGFISLVV